MNAISKAPEAHERLGARDHDGWLPPRRRDDPPPAPRDPLFVMATVTVPQARALMQVTMAVMGPGAPARDARSMREVTGEVIAKSPQPFAERSVSTSRPPAAAVVARYLANVESGQPRSRRSVYA